ncbi:Major Facilitator Superfamily [Seminavis robusta]|uniref:Major Facilitator Superfamily n=1 Tax=Seminavis robusta TaxID=568900 RepID=A0A9N8H3N9_9STRA|nr:Major Facilitator Superfamily [Seminavis robusta]|eukprot:Sro65_g036820.1 Major Facilitator Superfamily (606) ;mRNA; f:91472-93289
MCRPSISGGDDAKGFAKTFSSLSSSDGVVDNSRKDDAKKPRHVWTLTERSCLVLFACLQNALAGGLAFGWASIDRTMLIASQEQGGAGLTPMETTKIFSWASSVAMLSSLAMGLVLDRFGPRTASVLCNLLVGTGCYLFSMARSFEAIAIATCMIAFGGPGISSSIVHVANLFPQNQFLMLSILCGSVTFSFSVLAVFGDLWERYNWGFRVLFGGYVVVIALSTLGSFRMWPDVPFESEDSDAHLSNNNKSQAIEEGHPLLGPVSPEQEFVEATLSHHQLVEEPLNSGLRQQLAYGRTQSYDQSAGAFESGQEYATATLVSLKDQPFWNQFLSQTYVRNLLIFVTSSFFVNFTIASISTELADQQVFSIETQHDLARSFTLIMSGGLVASIFVGWLMDRVGLETCTIVSLVLGQTSLLLRIVGQSYNSMLFGYVLYTLFRQFLFPVFIACLTAKLGFKYFGFLSGIGFALSGIAQFSMASLVHFLSGDCHLQKGPIYATQPCSHGSWNLFHILQIAMLASLTIIPILDRREAARQQERHDSIVKIIKEYEGASPSTEAHDDNQPSLPRRDSVSSHTGSFCSAPPSGMLGQSLVTAYGATGESSVV